MAAITLIAVALAAFSPRPVARGECLTLPVDDDLTFIEATDLPGLLKTATVVDASRTNGHLVDSVHVPQHEWDFLTPAARKLCAAGRRLRRRTKEVHAERSRERVV